MHSWEQIQTTIDYLEAHIAEDVDIDELAKMAALSPFYYQRLFKRLVGKPACEYVKLRRMAKATEALLDKDKRILDIALDMGFSSHEHFTRVFKATFGMTPESYRNHPQALNHMTKPEIMLNYVVVDEGVPLITNGIVLEINRRRLNASQGFIGLEMTLPVNYLDGLGTKSGVDPLDALWNEFHEKKTSRLGLPDDREELGATLPCSKEGHFTYFAGAASNGHENVDGYSNWELPAGEYVVCSFEAESFETLVMDALYKALQYVYSTWLPYHKLKTAPFCAERYRNHGPGTTQMEIWLMCV